MRRQARGHSEGLGIRRAASGERRAAKADEIGDRLCDLAEIRFFQPRGHPSSLFVIRELMAMETMGQGVADARSKIFVTIGLALALAVFALLAVRVLEYRDVTLNHWALIATIFGPPVSVMVTLLPGVIKDLVKKPASKLEQKVSAGTIVDLAGQPIGHIPPTAPHFVERAELFERLTKSSQDLQIYTVVGRRGVGKSQLVAAVARKRSAQHWRIIAWFNAQSEAHLLAGYREAAIHLGLDRDHLSDKELAVSVKHWFEANGERCLLVLR